MELEDDVFCGPSMVFTNVINPRSHVPRKNEYRRTLVKQGASMGANSTVVCGVTLGRYCFIGAGAVVTKDVPDYALMVGVPAERIGWMCYCGVRLADEEAQITCAACGRRYRLERGTCKEMEVIEDENADSHCRLVTECQHDQQLISSLPGYRDATSNSLSSDLAIDGGRCVRTRKFPPWPSLSEDEVEAAAAVLRSGKLNYWTGEQGRRFETEFAAVAGCQYAVAVANGTVALELALYALGIGAGDEVIVPSRTFFASAGCAVSRGARPVFADVDPISQTLTADTIRKVLSPNTKAIHCGSSGRLAL